jgi:hypothetical protein
MCIDIHIALAFGMPWVQVSMLSCVLGKDGVGGYLFDGRFRGVEGAAALRQRNENKYGRGRGGGSGSGGAGFTCAFR